MGVPAKNALSLALFCVTERALRYLCGQTQPSCVETVQVAGKPFAPEIQLLQLQIDELANPAEPVIVDGKAVELMAMNGQMTLAFVFPEVMLIDRNADQMRHQFRQPVVVIAFHPNDLNLMFGIGELADKAEKFPMLFGKASEIQVGKDVTEQDQPLESEALEQFQCVSGAAYLRTQVQIGNNDGVKVIRQHALLL